ncbi:DUF6160 family protein [Bacterioplanoides sp.]|uniref:DUF6160 family protein n=1 Tax=Bacterioplanoides sp. TaxID=2066072 RepID=UPI003B007433
MKFLNKATLAAAIAAAPFAAQAELKAMDDAALSATTGQAGVTIEIDIEGAGVSVGEIEYTDTGSGATGGGSVLLQNVNINNVTGLTQTIDINEEGDLLVTQSGVTGMSVTLGDVAGVADNQYSAVALKGANGTAELVDSVSITMDLGNSDIVIHNMADGSTLGAAAGITGTNAGNTSSVAIQMATSVQITDMDVQMFGYTADQAIARTGLSLTGGNSSLDQEVATRNSAVVTAQGQLDAANADLITANAAFDSQLYTVGTDSSGRITTVTLNSDGSDATGALAADIATQNTAVDAVSSAQAAKSDADAAKLQSDNTASLADGGAVTIENLTFDNNGAPATINQTIWADSDGVYIQMGQIQGDLTIGSIGIGNNAQGQALSIGSVAVRDINLSGLTQRISGHD